MDHTPYHRRVQYYETDQMGIVHHSNYIRWFEEARLDYLNQLGLNYKSIEDQGILIPVTEVSCQFLIPVKYDDLLTVTPILIQYTGVRLSFRYEIRFQHTGELAATGTSGHCFLDQKRKPIALKRKAPELHRIFEKQHSI